MFGVGIQSFLSEWEKVPKPVSLPALALGGVVLLRRL